MMNGSEVIKRVRAARSPEEVAAIAKENGSTITGERAAEIYARFHGTGALADEELEDVAGGCGGGGGNYNRTCPWCGGQINIYPEGDFCDGCGCRF